MNNTEFEELKSQFLEDSLENSNFRDISDRIYDARRNYWPGQANPKTYRKEGDNAFPWKGASDQEVHLIEERIQTHTALCVNALRRASVQAYPANAFDLEKARRTTLLMRYFKQEYIEGLMKAAEANASELFEVGLSATYVGWRTEKGPVKDTVSLAQIAQASPDLAEAILNTDDPEKDQVLVEYMSTMLSEVGKRRIKQYLKQIKELGYAEIESTQIIKSCPYAERVSMVTDLFFPQNTRDYTRAPRCFWRQLVTEQELRSRVVSEELDDEWVEKVIEKTLGQKQLIAHDTQRQDKTSRNYAHDDLVEIVYAYEQEVTADYEKIIRCTVFSPHLTVRDENEVWYGKREILEGYTCFPFVVTPYLYDQTTMYETRSLAEMLMPLQHQIKIERDMRIDAGSLRTLPPVYSEMGLDETIPFFPGATKAVMDPNKINIPQTPQYETGSERIEQNLMRQADLVASTAPDLPETVAKQQFFVDKFLDHQKEVIKLAFKMFKMYGPDQLAVRVMGSPDPALIERESTDVAKLHIEFDVRQLDPEQTKAKLQAMSSLMQFDTAGRINVEAWLEMMAVAIDPIIADAVLQSSEEGTKKMQERVMDDIAKIFAGMEVEPTPNGAQTALQVLQTYVQQPDIQERLQSDEAFANRLQNYQQKYVFQMQQQQNAQIGRIGGRPATFGRPPADQ